MLYLSVATHQQPDNRQYRDAYLSARVHQAEKKATGPIAGAFSILFERARRSARPAAGFRRT